MRSGSGEGLELALTNVDGMTARPSEGEDTAV